jgi:hypothetical protein
VESDHASVSEATAARIASPARSRRKRFGQIRSDDFISQIKAGDCGTVLLMVENGTVLPNSFSLILLHPLTTNVSRRELITDFSEINLNSYKHKDKHDSDKIGEGGTGSVVSRPLT